MKTPNDRFFQFSRSSHYGRLALLGFSWCWVSALAADASVLTPPFEPVLSERGAVPIQATSPVELYRVERDQAVIPRHFEQQPPLIPHGIKGYSISQNFNKCMDCHSLQRATETRATKVSATHYQTREGAKLANISPRRYFCLQCHVPQTDAKPLVDNTYKPAASLKAY